MATMVTSTRPVIKKGAGGGPSLPGPNGNGSKRKGGFPDPDSRSNRYRIGMWVGLASIAMMFTSLSSAYIVRYASANDWLPLAVPRAMFVSTALIVISSITIELARRKLKRSFQDAYRRYLLFTVLLGLAFLVSQLISWRQLARQGIYLASNPHSSFFYLLTGAHAVHLFGGLLALAFLWLRWRREVSGSALIAKRQATTDAVTIYWHFMDGLWIYLFLLLFLWR
ncbi:MAG TPA: cytochrome c oxidase subunit 3 [Pyrinomonadaceae bacterium]|nr:cytochrome c oxidase subunit 3 [Pyrinomonadaceae bacterium]